MNRCSSPRQGAVEKGYGPHWRQRRLEEPKPLGAAQRQDCAAEGRSRHASSACCMCTGCILRLHGCVVAWVCVPANAWRASPSCRRTVSQCFYVGGERPEVASSVCFVMLLGYWPERLMVFWPAYLAVRPCAKATVPTWHLTLGPSRRPSKQNKNKTG